jgi:hypothetical protein
VELDSLPLEGSGLNRFAQKIGTHKSRNRFENLKDLKMHLQPEESSIHFVERVPFLPCPFCRPGHFDSKYCTDSNE